MNDKVKQLYDLYVSNGLIKSVDFNTFSNASEEQRSQLYNLGRQNGLFETTDFNTFSSAFGGQQQGPAPYATGKGPAQVEQPTKQEPLKKKEPTSLVSSSATTPSVSQEEPPKITDYLQQPAEETKIQAPYAEGKEPVFIKKEGEPVQNLRQLTEEQYASEQQKAIESGKITPAKISGKETFIPTIETKNLPKEDLEENYFKGSFGNVLKGFDEVVPLGIGDFIDDMARSVSSGYRQGVAAKDADRLLLKGSKATPEQIQKFIESQKAIQQSGPSAEMQDYQRIYEKEGKGFWGVIKGLISNPSVIPELITSSLTAMATNTDALTAASSAIGTGASIGAAAGAPAGGIGAIPGAAAGATASIPYAFGLASSIVEAGSTFGELIQEELNGQEFTKENVKKILEDPTKLNKIRNKAIARGLIIGTVDAFTGKLASGVGAKIIERGAAKSATGVATRGTLAKATAAGAGVEALGGSGGEAIARGATGQEMDISEISLEGLAELPSGIRSTIQARLTKPTFRVNGERVNADQVDELINTMTPDELSKTNIEIKNDFEGRKNKIQDKIITGQIKKEVQQANPNIEDNDLNQLVDLEKELRSFENNKTQSGKDRAADIRLQIKNIQQNAVQKQAAGQVPVQPTTGVSEKVEEGKPTTESEVVTEEGIEETVAPKKEVGQIGQFLVEGISGDVGGYESYTEKKAGDLRGELTYAKDRFTSSDGVEMQGGIVEKESEDGKDRIITLGVNKTSSQGGEVINGKLVGGTLVDHVGRNAYYSVSVSVPKESKTTAEDVKQMLVDKAAQIAEESKKQNPKLKGIAVSALKTTSKEVAMPKAEAKVEAEVTPTVLANVENTSTALESVPVEEKMDLEFTQEDGTVSPVNGNERMLSDMYHKAVALPEDQRTEPQKQVVSLVEQSLSNDIEVERLERELAKPEVAEGPVTTVGISISNDTDIENLKNTTKSKAQAARTESEKKSAETKVKILETAQRAIKAIKNIFPDIDIVIHDNEESYNNEVRRLQGQEGSGGNFAIITDANGKETRRIDINLSKANERTVAHETAHALLEKAFGDDPKLFQRFKDAISKILSAEKNEELNKFIERYTNKEVRPEEYLVELTGMLEQQEATVAFKPSTLQKIAELINKFVSAITGGKLVAFRNVKDTKDIVDFLNTVSGAIREGKEVAIKEAKKAITPKVVSKAQMVAVAPYFNTQVKTTVDANNLRKDENYIKYKESLKEVATLLGFPDATINETIGGYQNDAGEKIVEISNKIDLKDATIEEAAEFAAMAAVIAPEVQESSIAFKYVKENSPSHNANEYVVKVEDLDKAVDALKVAGINNFSIDDNNKTISFINVFEFQDPKLEEKIINFVEELESKGVNYEQPKYKSIEFKYVDKGERKKILRRIESKGSERRRLGEDFRPYIESAIKRDAEFQKTTIDEYIRGRAGNRTFNKPLEGVNEIADRYYQRAFGKPRPKYKGTEKLDRERAKRLSDAFIAMKHAPNDPKVRAAYEALVKETIEQYKAFLDAGYSVEINNTEPYRNSQEMIDDLRNNKRIKIFSTESGFGGEKITEKQRKDNPLLAETTFKDVNGEPLLVNDLFRAVHDFFGHAELGNGFGPKGEENAWNVHARMFSPLARKAMTTETRGQNSYVNFSEVNQDADKLREEARRLREEGKIEEANKVSDRVVNLTQFAEQKIGLLPDEFTEIDLKDEGDLTRVISKSQATEDNIIDYTDIFGKKIKINVENISLEPEGEINFEDERKWNRFKIKHEKIEIGIIQVQRKGDDVKIAFSKIWDHVHEYKKSSSIEKIKKLIKNILSKIFPKFFKFKGNVIDSSSNKGKGLGSKTYGLLAKILQDQYGKKLISDTTRSDYAEALWRSLERKGLAKVVGDRENAKARWSYYYEYIVPKEKTISKSSLAGKDINNVIKRGRAAGVSERAIRTVLKKQGFTDAEIDAAMGAEKGAAKKVTVSEEMLPGFNRMMEQVDGIVTKSRERGVSEDKVMENVMRYVEGSKAYENASDVQREQIIRDIEKRFGVKQKAAPKVERVVKPMGEEKKVALSDEMSALKDQIRLEARAAKEGAKSVSDAVKAITKYFNEIKDRGNLTRKDIVNVLNIISEVKDQQTLDKAAEKIFNIVGKAKTDIIEVSELKALKDQIRLEARAAKDAKSAMRRSLDFVSRTVKELARSGKISVKQAANVLRKFSSINPLSKESVDRFVDYMSKVFADADYSNKLSFALETKRSISKLSKNKDKDANLRALGEKFSEIDPSMVENIDEYNEMASAIKESIKGSTFRREAVMPAQMVNINEAMDYTEKTMKAQDKKMAEIKAAEIQEIMGIDASELSYEQMLQLLDSKEPITKYNEGIIRDTINRMFDVYSSMIDSMIESGIDPMTGEPVELSKTQKELVKKFMEMDLNKLTPKEALSAVDALNNFIVNKSTAKMETVVRQYTGDTNAINLADKGVKSKPLQMYWIKGVGRFFGEQFASLPTLIERMFKGVMAGAKIEKASGLTDVKNGKAEAESNSNRIVEEYVDKFYKEKANGEAFNTEANVTERGIVSFMSRSVTGTEEEIQQDFNRRKKLIEESIDALSKGSEKEQAKAELYKAAYDKVLKDSYSAEDVRRKADKKNLEAVDFWIDKWSSIYDQLSDVSENVYNKILDKDIDYTPDRFTRLERAQEEIDLDSDQSVFHGNTNTLYKKETGVLMKAERPESLPKDDKGKKPAMYIDLSFDKNNANSMYDALVDINTAGPIRQVQSFLNSEGFDRMVPEVKDAKVLKERVKLYISNIRKKNAFDNDEMSAMMRKLNTISAIGVGQALGGILQPFKQTIPVAMNTLVNAGGLDIGSIFNSSKMNFIDNSGYAIANRGIESQTQLKSINKLMDLAAESKGIKALKYIEKANKIWLDIFLVKPDSFIARASWMSYYEQSLKKQGIDPGDIDYNTHKINKEAADYAQTMVDRQQNISDSDLQGKLFSSKTALSQLFVKTLLPFANFRMNQFMRLTNDITTLTSMTSSKEDKVIAARSLGGYSVEVAAFTAISTAAGMLLYELSKTMMGEGEDEEEEERRKSNMIKGQITGRVTDILSPLPFLDKPIAAGVNMAMDKVQEAMDIVKEDRLSIYGDTKVDMVKSLGTLGITLERGAQLYDLYDLARTGEYTDSYGNVKKISESSRAYLEGMTAAALLTNIGLAPSEVNNIVRNSIKLAKSTGKTEATIEREVKAEENKTESHLLLNELREQETDPELIDAIDKRISELEDKSEVAKEKRKARKEEKERLLQGYKNMDEMKRYDPELYEETFGEGSDYYEKHKDEVLINKAYNKLERQKRDEEMNYIPPPKESKKKKKGFGSEGFGTKGFGSKGFGSKGF